MTKTTHAALCQPPMSARRKTSTSTVTAIQIQTTQAEFDAIKVKATA